MPLFADTLYSSEGERGSSLEASGYVPLDGVAFSRLDSLKGLCHGSPVNFV